MPATAREKPVVNVSRGFISAEPFVKVSWALGMSKEGRPIINPKAYYEAK